MVSSDLARRRHSRSPQIPKRFVGGPTARVTSRNLDSPQQKFKMGPGNGKLLSPTRFARTCVATSARRSLERSGVEVDDADWLSEKVFDDDDEMSKDSGPP